MSTVADVLARVRADLNEPVAGVWQDTDLITWINQGIYQVSSRLKGVRDDWTTRRMRSTDSSETIYGSTYDPGSLTISSGTDLYTMPPNLIEIRSLEPLDQEDKDAGIRFLPMKMTRLEPTQLYRDAGSNTRVFYYDLFGVDQLRIIPVPDATIEVELFYTAAPEDSLTSLDEITQVPRWALLAVQNYAVYMANRAINHPDSNALFGAFKEQIAELVSFAAPRKSNDPVIVEGIFDEEDMLPFDLEY